MGKQENNWRIRTMRRETSKLVRELSSDQYEIGDIITDEHLERISGVSCQVGGPGYGYLQTAIRRVAREDNRLWKRLPGCKVIKRLTPEETIEDLNRDRCHIARTARRSLVKSNTVNMEGLDHAEASALRVQAAQLGTLAMFASTRTSKALEARRTDRALELDKLLEAMTDGDDNGEKKPEDALKGQ